MSDGRIFYAEQDGNYCLKFVGDVRVTLCTTLKNYINKIFDADNVQSIVLDLTESQAVDSTTLGFMAKVALFANDKNIQPILITKDASMLRLIEGMGFDEICQILSSLPQSDAQLEEMQCTSVSTEQSRQQVIEAHRVLMSMNSKNMHAFSELVTALERESDY